MSATGELVQGRFVILEHTWEGVHWDFMLEFGGKLKTWRLPQLPQPGVRLSATALPDHRLAYLEYEGPVSRGRGVVRRVERGTYTGSVSDDLVKAEIRGERIQGLVHLIRRSDDEWEFVLSAVADTSSDSA